MAELVEFNLEQSIPFFNGLKTHIDDEKLKHLVRKRRHYEYKICSLNREFKSFKDYMKHELGVLDFISNLQVPEVKNLIRIQKNLVERIIKQMTIHFQSEPKAFLIAVQVMRKMRRTTSERYYWEELLNKHGCKDVRFYLTAASCAMHDILPIINARNKYQMKSALRKIEDNLHFAKNHNKIRKIAKLEQEKAEIECENKKQELNNYIDYMEWARKRFIDGFDEFPKHKLLFLEYLKFEIINRDFFSKLEDVEEEMIAVREGRLVEYLLKKSLEYFSDKKTFQEIANLASTLETPLLQEINDRIRSCPSEPEQMDLQTQEIVITDEDKFSIFQRKYPDLKCLRPKNPANVGKELHEYLQIVKDKFIKGELDKASHIVSLRKEIEWILQDHDWASTAIDLWWDYYELESCCGDQMKAFMVLNNADRKLSFDFKYKLKMRKFKSDSQK